MNYIIAFFLILNLGLQNEVKIEPPKLLFPENESYINSGDITFGWTKTDKKHVYEIIISQDIEFTNPQRFSCSDTTILVPLTYTSGNLYWKVRAFKNDKKYSDWSETYHCYINDANQIKTNIMSPCGRIGGCAGCGGCGRRNYNDNNIKTE